VENLRPLGAGEGGQLPVYAGPVLPVERPDVHQLPFEVVPDSYPRRRELPREVVERATVLGPKRNLVHGFDSVNGFRDIRLEPQAVQTLIALLERLVLSDEIANQRQDDTVVDREVQNRLCQVVPEEIMQVPSGEGIDCVGAQKQKS
jgi:hypothetical protein